MSAPIVIFRQKARTQMSYIPRLYGRRQDKPLKPRQARLMETLLPHLAVPSPAAGEIDPFAMMPGHLPEQRLCWSV